MIFKHYRQKGGWLIARQLNLNKARKNRQTVKPAFADNKLFFIFKKILISK